MNRPMSMHEYKTLFESGKAPPRGTVQGLAFRVIRRKSGGPWEVIDDDDRKVAFFIDAEGGEKLIGASWYQILINIGWDDAYIRRKILDEKCDVALLVLPEISARLGTWDNVLDAMGEEYGSDIAAKLNHHRAQLRQLSPFDLPAIEQRLGHTFAEVDRAGKSDPRYMTVARYRAVPGVGTLEQARAFCYFAAHLRELFYGDGWTRDNVQRRGIREFVVAGRRGSLDYLGQHLVIPGQVTVPALTPAVHTAWSPAYGLPLPPHFDPKLAASWTFSPNQGDLFNAADEWRRAHNVKLAATDDTNVHVLLIDVQRDFCHPLGSLFVGGRSRTGAVDDTRRTAEFLYRNLGLITNITTTLDTHFAYQIFFPSFWVDRNGAALQPHREITSQQIHDGEVRPNPAVAKWLCNGNYTWLLKQVTYYCEQLEKAGKYKLYLWPPHCMLGSDGHALIGLLHEARLFHAFVRGTQSWCEVKGGNPLTENYSVMQPEVLARHDGQPLAQRNTLFLKTLLSADAVIIAGQAASHCVKSSIDDILTEIVATDRSLAKKIYLLADCMSAVAVPDGKGGFVADFTAEAQNALGRFEAAGMNVVRSTDDPRSWKHWPGARV